MNDGRPHFPGQTPADPDGHAVPVTDLQTPPAPPTRSNVPTWAKVLGALVLVALVIMVIAHFSAGQAAGVSTAGGQGAAGGGGPYTITIEGDGTASVTMNQDGAGSQQTDVPLPYSTTIDSGARLVSVVGQLSGPDSGNGLSCSITDAAGDVVQQSSSSGDYTTVTCSASLQ